MVVAIRVRMSMTVLYSPHRPYRRRVGRRRADLPVADTVVVTGQGHEGEPAPIGIDEAIAMLVSVRLIRNQTDWITDPVRD